MRYWAAARSAAASAPTSRKAGYDVTVIDQWPAQVEALKANGLRITMPDGEVKTPIRALHLCDLASSNLEFDIVFLAVKSNDDRWLAEFIRPYLKPDGVLVGTQNGMNDDTLASILGRERVVGCAMELSAEIFTPGLVKRNTTHKTTWFAVGELDGFYTPRVKEIAEILGHVGPLRRHQQHLRREVDQADRQHDDDGAVRPAGARQLGRGRRCPACSTSRCSSARESLAVGTALGYRTEPIFGLRADEFAGSERREPGDGDEDAARPREPRAHRAHPRPHQGPQERDGVHQRRRRAQGQGARHRRRPSTTPWSRSTGRSTSGELKMDPSNFELLKKMVI